MEVLKASTSRIVVKTHCANKCKKLLTVPNTKQTLKVEWLVLWAISDNGGIAEAFWAEVWHAPNYTLNILFASKQNHVEILYEYAGIPITNI